MLVFGKLRFKNFQSFGNEFSEVDFNSQILTLITGQNGAGKSTIVDALNFVLFGRPYRKIKIGDLVNRTNGKHLHTEIELSKNNQQWKIIRGLSPQKLEIYKGKEQLPRQDIKEMQVYIETNILGFDEKIFRQIVTLGSGYYVPFLKLPLAQKREVIEQLFELDIFSKMKAVVKDKLSKQQTKLYELSGKKTILENTIVNLKEEHDRALKHNESVKQLIEQEKERLREMISLKKKNIELFKIEITNKENEIEKEGKGKIIEDMNSLKIKISESTIELKTLQISINEKHKDEFEKLQIDKQNHIDTISRVSTEKIKLELELKNVESEIYKRKQEAMSGILTNQALTRKEIDNKISDLDFYSKNTVCPTCKSELTGDKIRAQIADLKEKKDHLCEALLQSENQIEELTKKFADEWNTKSTRIKEKTIDCNEIVNTARRELDQIEDLIELEKGLVKEEFANQSKIIDDDNRSRRNLVADLETKLLRITKHEEEIQEIKSNIKETETWIKTYEAKIATADNDAKYISVDAILEKLKENRTNLVDLGKNEKRETLIYDYFKVMENLTSDSGIKTQIIKHYLPILTQKINEYLSLFQAEYSIELTDEFDVQIKFRHNEYVDYDNFSGGEKIRIDLALMFSFVSFLKMRTGAMCSLLFFDEILDSSLDMNGIAALVQILKLFTQNGFSIYVVSHREENKSEDFGKILEVKKERFSEIKEA
jgi:DNA repair exonuclease SbcCD ATPase subunit